MNKPGLRLPTRDGWVLLSMLLLWAPVNSLAQGGDGTANNVYLVTGVIIILVLIGASIVSLIVILQKKFIRACRQTDNMALYARTPFGVPAGTIRSMLAMIIVFVSLALITLSMLNQFNFPEVMAGILGTVLGFYFGSRGSASQGDSEALTQISDSVRARDEAIEQNNQSQLTGLLAKARAGIDLAKSLTGVLPKETAGSLGKVLATASKGLQVVDGLAGTGKTAEALVQATKTVASLQQDNPIKGLLRSALGTFGKVAPAVPAVAIVGAVVFVGARLASTAYSRWQARILNAPYTPELFPATVVDAAVAVSVVRTSPIFADKFKAELDQGNLKLLRDLVREALQDDSEAALWKREDVGARFETMDELRAGVDEIQRSAITQEISKDVEPELFAPVGGMDNFLRAVDQINADDKAQADLDQIMLVVNQLRTKGQPVEELFRDSISELQAEATT